MNMISIAFAADSFLEGVLEILCHFRNIQVKRNVTSAIPSNFPIGT